MVEGRRDQVGSADPDKFRVEMTSETALVRLCSHSTIEMIYSEPLSLPKYFYNQDDN